MDDPLDTTSFPGTDRKSRLGPENAEDGEAGRVSQPEGLVCPCTQGGPCLCAASGGRRRISLFKCAMALALVGVVGSFAMLKPDPEGVRAGDIEQSARSQHGRGSAAVPLDQLRDHLMNGSASRPKDDPECAPSEAWMALGSLEGGELTVLIEARDTSFVYTVSGPDGQPILTRVTREELQSMLPHMDVDSLTATPHLPRLMLADDREH